MNRMSWYRARELSAGNGVEVYLALLARRRWPLLFLILVAAGGLAAGMKFLSINENYRALFSANDPQLQAYQYLEEEYTQLDNIYFVFAPDDGEVFTKTALRALRELTEEAWRIPYVQRVDSIANYQYSRADGDDVFVSGLLDDFEAKSPEALTKVRQICVTSSDLVNYVISPKGDVAGINVLIRLPKNANGAQDEVIAGAKRAAETIRQKYPGVDVYLTGRLAMNVAFKEAALRDVRKLAPLMYLGVILAVFLLLRSIVATLVTVAVVALSTATGMGLAGWFGYELSASSSSAPTLILTLAVLDCVHILMTTMRRMWSGEDQRSALLHSMQMNLIPVFLTSLTTVIGFLAMNFADSPPLRDVGNITAMGVASAYVYTMILVPVLLAMVTIRAKPRRPKLDKLVDGLGRFVVARFRVLLASCVSIVILLALAIPRNEINDRWVEYFDRSTAFRQATEFAIDHVVGAYMIVYSPDSGEPDGVVSPKYLETVDTFTQWLRDRTGVVHVDSLVNTIKRLNMNMHGDDPEWYRVPGKRELAAQYLLLYEMSLPQGLELDSHLNDNRSAMRIVVLTRNITSNQLLHLSESGTQWLRDHAPACMVSDGTGPAIMFAHLARRNIHGMIYGTAVAFVLIASVMLFALRKPKYALISLIPNIVPAVCAFGVWGIFNGNVGFAVWTVGAMSLGFVVDDTVHFLSKYAYARQRLGQSAPDSVQFAFNTVGSALVITSVILGAGFLIVSCSSFKVNSSLGSLTAIIIAFALAADFLLLPSLLLWLDTDSVSEAKHSEESEHARR